MHYSPYILTAIFVYWRLYVSLSLHRHWHMYRHRHRKHYCHRHRHRHLRTNNCDSDINSRNMEWWFVKTSIKSTQYVFLHLHLGQWYNCVWPWGIWEKCLVLSHHKTLQMLNFSHNSWDLLHIQKVWLPSRVKIIRHGKFLRSHIYLYTSTVYTYTYAWIRMYLSINLLSQSREWRILF